MSKDAIQGNCLIHLLLSSQKKFLLGVEDSSYINLSECLS